MLWIAIAAAGVIALAIAVVCLAVPLVISVRAPDSGDLFSVKVRHAALSVDLWLPLDVVLHWIAGIAEPPPIAGHIAGVPLPPRALAPVANQIAKTIAGRKEPAPAEDATPKPPGRFDVWKKRAIAATPEAAWDQLPRIKRAVVIEQLSFDLEYGTGDPVTTGMIAGFLWQLAAVLPEPCYIRAEAHWLEPRIRVEGEARVLIFPWRTIVAGLCLGLAVARSAWRASRATGAPQPPAAPKETSSWPRIRTGTETPAEAAPPSSPS